MTYRCWTATDTRHSFDTDDLFTGDTVERLVRASGLSNRAAQIGLTRRAELGKEQVMTEIIEPVPGSHR